MNITGILSHKSEIISGKTLSALIGVTFFILAMAFGAYIRVPVPGTPVPITLQTLFVLLSGAVLGQRLGSFSQAGYIFLGAAGFPVFQGYASGAAHLLGPTGGYLAGFVLASLLIGKLFEKGNAGILETIAFFILGDVVLYGLGILWLMLIYRIGLVNAIAMGLLPFLAVEAVKILAAAFIYRAIANRSRKIF